MLSIKRAMSRAIETLKNANIKSANLDSRILLKFVTGKSLEYLISRCDEKLTDSEEVNFLNFIERRVNLEPISYIIGSKEFYGYNFCVNNNVLIPRPDTEILVDAIVSYVLSKDNDKKSNTTMLELGIGTGCVSISLLLTLESANIIGTDISNEAILIANKNAQIHSVSNRLNILYSNWFSNVNTQKFDVIFSNPPYIPKSEIHLMEYETIHYEPHNALFIEDEEFNAYQYIAKDAKTFLKEDGKLFVEVGFNQADSVIEIFNSQDFIVYKIYNDLAGYKRVISFTKT